MRHPSFEVLWGFRLGYRRTDPVSSACIFVLRTGDPKINCKETILFNTSRCPDSRGRNCAQKVRGSMNPTLTWCRDSGRESGFRCQEGVRVYTSTERNSPLLS